MSLSSLPSQNLVTYLITLLSTQCLVCSKCSVYANNPGCLWADLCIIKIPALDSLFRASEYYVGVILKIVIVDCLTHISSDPPSEKSLSL